MWFKRNGNLQTMCLNVVVSNINLFSLPNAVPEIHIEFLRRAYSEKLFQLITEGWYPNRYLVWLISPYWKNVSLPGLGYSSSDILSKFMSVGNKIESLHLEYSDSSPYFLTAMICCVPNITELNLTGTLITNEIVLLIRKMCPNLNTLNLSFCESLTSKAIQNLCYRNNELTGYPSLESLNISETHIGIEGFIFLLEHLTSLKVLHFTPAVLWLHRMHGRWLDNAGNIVFENATVKYNITNFEYSDATPYATAELDDVLELLSIICPLIEDVTIRKKLNNNTFRLLGKLKFLKQLNLYNINYYYPIVAPSISSFLRASGSILTHLKLYGKISISVDVLVKFCPNLEFLELCSVVYEDFESSAKPTKLMQMNNLQVLILNNLSFNQDLDFKSVVLLLRSSINLTKVTIQSAKYFTDKITKFILKLPNLEAVDFSFTDINEETVLPFFACPTIKTLHIDGCPYISDHDEKSYISELMMNSYHGKNTCSWALGYD